MEKDEKIVRIKPDAFFVNPRVFLALADPFMFSEGLSHGAGRLPLASRRANAVPLLLNCQSFPALGPAPAQNESSPFCGHAGPEAVCPLSFGVGNIDQSFLHDFTPYGNLLN